MNRIKNINIIDDDQLLTELLRFKIIAAGYNVTIANDANEGYEQIRNIKPDLIILDAMMPGMSGFQMLQILKEDDENKDIPVIMLTMKKQEKDILKAFKLGVSDYLTKPFIPDELIVRLENCMNKQIKVV